MKKSDQSEHNQIVEKIKKLLALASSDNEMESRHAMETAQRLMAKYSISLCDDPSDENNRETIVEETYESEYYLKQGVLEVIPSIVATISPIFGVYGLVQIKPNWKIKLVGYSTNILVTRYALDSLLAQGVAMARSEYKKNRSVTFGLSFWAGFAIGLHRKFSTFANESSAIVVYDPVRAYMASQNLKSHKNNLIDGSARTIGIESGLKADLRKGLSQSDSSNNQNERKLLQ